MQEVLKVIIIGVLDQTYSYLPIDLANNEKHIGKRALVDFAGKVQTAIIRNIEKVENSELELLPYELKQIIKILDSEPYISNNLLLLADWISAYYICSIGEAIKPLVPNFFNIKSIPRIKFNDNFLYGYEISKSLKRKISAIKSNTLINIENIIKDYKISKNEIELLYNLKLININEKLDERINIPKQFKITCSPNVFEIIISLNTEFTSKELIKLNNILDLIIEDKIYLIEDIKIYFKITNKLFKKFIEHHLFYLEEAFTENIEFLPPYKLNAEQEEVFNIVSENFSNNYTYLLQGITGSGKTLVYLYLINEVLKSNKTAIVLIPEIYLTTQLLNRFESVFPNQIAVLHSKVVGSAKQKTYKQIIEGKYKIVIGARSAIFAPIANLGIIIVDEEHDQSFKQDSPNPRYNGRDVAIMRAKLENCTCILGSATPSLESYHNAINGKYHHLQLNNRAEEASLPNIEVIDLISAKENNEIYNSFTKYLIEQIELNKKKNLVSIIFNNRRGYSNIIECPDCGNIEHCINCDITLTYHKEKNELICHYCDYKINLNKICRVCGSDKYKHIGYGTQKIEEISTSLFEGYNILRLDSDVTKKSKGTDTYHSDIKKGNYDIIIGTQLVSKGLDYPNIGLIGVLNADYNLQINDFRANERTYQLLSQLAGRAGRSKDLASKVIIQSKETKNNLFYFLINNKINDFLLDELEQRKKSNLPPYSRIIMIEFSSLDRQLPMLKANFFFNKFNKSNFYKLYPPFTPEVSFVQKMYRSVLVIKVNKEFDKSGNKLSRRIKDFLNSNIKSFSKVNIKVNVDIQHPIN